MSRTVSLPGFFTALLVLDAIYQGGIRHVALGELAWLAPLDAALYAGILLATARFDLARLTLAYLGLPYFLFLPTWLNLPAAAVTLGIFALCLWRTGRQVQTRPAAHSVQWRHLLAFVAILVWVNLSGAGGYGYQTQDYELHNGRLRDLVVYPWPVRYSDHRNLIYYVGYFLPAAALGKLSDFHTALRALYPWTLLGVTLAMRWLALLSGRPFTFGLVLIFALFGPLDVFGSAFMFHRTGATGSWLQPLLQNSDHLDFWASDYLGIFVGNFLSNTFQLYWSPHQVVSGWLAIALMTDLFEQRRSTHLVFVYSLLCLWAPLVMIVLLPFVAVGVAYGARQPVRELLTLENGVGAGVLATLFLIFYSGGSALKNPSFWTLTAFDLARKWDGILLLYLFGWGLYVAAIFPSLLHAEKRQRAWFYCLLLTLLILPLRTYGEYNDLLCRGSVPLMFLLLVFLLRHMRRNNGAADTQALILASLLLFGSSSALLQTRMALEHYGETRDAISVPEYLHANEDLGPDDSLFARYLRRRPP